MGRLPVLKCAAPLCNNPREPNSRYCKFHAKMQSSGWGNGRYQTDPIYRKKKWRDASKRYRKAHPLCECSECKRLNRILPAHHVDHIIPWKSGETETQRLQLFWDQENWQSINSRCHAEKTARERHNKQQREP